MRYIYIFTILLYQLNAQGITLSSEQEKSWNIQTMTPESSSVLPLGELIVEVGVPPASIRSISLSFEANVQQLNVAKFQEVKKGEVLAKVTGSSWIEAQQEAIANAIALKQQQSTTKRQLLLCKEGIIPQKECIESEAMLDLSRAKYDASKALLESYGAMPANVESIVETFKISPTLDVVSPYDGTIKMLDAVAGQTISPSEALFVVQQHGKLWLESKVGTETAGILTTGQEVQITLRGETFGTDILQVSRVIDAQSQTQLVRFDVPENVSLVAGTRATASITLQKPVLKVSKSAVINLEGKKILFVKKESSYVPLEAKVLGEDSSHYYIADMPAYRFPIATTSLAVLKNLTGEDDE